MLVDSSSVPPTRSRWLNWPFCGWSSTYTPAPVNVSEAVFASPVAYQSRPKASSSRSPVEAAGSDCEIGVHLPPPVELRHTPPLAPPV